MKKNTWVLGFFLFLVLGCSTSAPSGASAPRADQAPPRPAPNEGEIMDLAKAAPADAMATQSIEERKMEVASGITTASTRADGPADAKPGKNGHDDSTGLQGPQKVATQDRALKKIPALMARWEGEDQSTLPLAAQDVTVLTAGTRARVVLDLVFKNPTDRQLAGTLMIEMPQGASPAYLGMFLGGPGSDSEGLLSLNTDSGSGDYLAPEPVIPPVWKTSAGPASWGDFRPARVIEAAQSRQIYEQTVRSRVDPAMAEWAGGSNFSTKIFPLPPKSLKRVVFMYDRPLSAPEGDLVLDLPPVGSSGPSRLTVEVQNGTLSTPQLLDGSGTIKTQTPGRWSVERTKGQGFYTLTGKIPNPEVRTLIGTAPGIPGTLSQVLWKPELSFNNSLNNTGKAVFLVDTSFSGKSRLYSLTGRLLREILEKDSSITQFQVVSFDVTARAITRGWTVNTLTERQSLFKNLEEIWLEGATNLQSALDLVKTTPSLLEGETYFMLSDGQITWGLDSPAILERGYGPVFAKRWIAYSFGDSAVNRGLWDRLTRSGGQVIAAPNPESLPAAAAAHRRSTMSLESFKVIPESVDAWITGDPGPLSPGQVLEISLRAPPGVKTCTLVLKVGGVEKRMDVALNPETRTAALGARAWAESTAARLLALGDGNADRAAVALSQKFTLTNRVANYLILETDAEYTRFDLKDGDLNLPQTLRMSRSQGQGARPGALDFSVLSPEIQTLIDSLGSLPVRSLWQVTYKALAPVGLTELKETQKREKDTPLVLYNQSRGLFTQSPGQALRVLSTIPEVNPADDQGMRLVGFVLMEWGLYAQAEEVFTRLRIRRPFEPQNLFWEALALAAQGKSASAVGAFELILQGKWTRFGDFALPTVYNLYAEILRSARAQVNDTKLIDKRLAELESKSPNKIKGSGGTLVLFWNLDDTDLDLHVKEPGVFGETVYYEHKTSGSGAQLYWDNTQGLGPELYDIPNLPSDGLDVRVHYYGSSSAEGKAPAAAFLMARDKGNRVRFFTTALPSGKDELFPIMPQWKP